MENMIEFQEITKCFGDKKVLKRVSFQVKKGQIFGLLGPSGAGKTTIIKILTGQVPADSGISRIMGTDSSRIDGKLYTKIGMVLDNSGLYERLSCYDNLKMFASILEISASEIDVILKKVGLLDARKTTVNKLSKGMRQRLVIARAIFHNPEVLFLDEPTSGLDPATTLNIHEMLEELKEGGTTMFLTTHNMDEAAKLCDNIALLNEGHIIENGAPDEICRKYNNLNKVYLLCKDGREIVLANESKSAPAIAEYFTQNNVYTIHSSEPTLESVFIELTGRSLA